MHDYYVGVWHDLKQSFSQARLLYMYIFFLYVFFRNYLYCPELFYHFYMTNFPHVSQKKIIENVNRDWVFQLFNYVGFLELNLMIDYSTIKSLLLTPTMLASPCRFPIRFATRFISIHLPECKFAGFRLYGHEVIFYIHFNRNIVMYL